MNGPFKKHLSVRHTQSDTYIFPNGLAQTERTRCMYHVTAWSPVWLDWILPNKKISFFCV